MLARRMVQPAVRQEIIVVDTDTKRDSASSYIIFVDNESHSEGTFESPYPTLAQAEAASTPGSIVYVFPGNGSAYDTSVISTNGMTLLDSQMLLGASTSHTVSTNLGTITIPPYATTAPVISNEGIYGVGVTLANNNTVSGFSFVGNSTSQSGIEGTNVTNFTSIQNSFSNISTGYAILLEGTSGQVEIANNTFTGNYVGLYAYENSIQRLTISGSTFSSNTYMGAILESGGSIDSVILSGTEFMNNQTHGFLLNNGLSVGDLSLNACSFIDNGTDGIDIEGSVGSLTALYCTITGSGNSGLVLDSNSSAGTLTITGCNISNNDNEGLFIAAPIAGALTISGSHFDSNIAGHGFIFTNQATCNNVRVYQNTFNNNGRQGINADLSNCTSGQIAIFDNVFVNNDSLMEVGYSGAFTMSAGSACLQFTNNSASPTSYMGFDAFYWGQTGGTFNVTTDSTNANNGGGVISQSGTIGTCP